MRRGVFTAAEMADLLRDIEAADGRKPHPDILSRGPLRFVSNTLPFSDELRAFAAQQRLVDLVCEYLGPDIWVRWDQAVAKGPGAPEFPWHQDNAYNMVKGEHLQVWVAINESVAENGALWVLPESQHRLRAHRTVGQWRELVDPPEERNAVCLPAGPGDVVLFSSYLAHRTGPNTTASTRWAYVLEYFPLSRYDPFVTPPYYVAARGGRSCPGYVRWYRGRLNPVEQLHYLGRRLTVRVREGRWRREPGA